MPIKVYHYPRCGTCRRALQWMQARGVTYEPVDIVESPPSRDDLEDMWHRSGLPIRKLFNTSGQSYRTGNFKERLGGMSDDDALDALAADGKLIRRPLVDTGTAVLVGFKNDAYVAALS